MLNCKEYNAAESEDYGIQQHVTHEVSNARYSIYMYG